jgi:hypothetical protein
MLRRNQPGVVSKYLQLAIETWPCDHFYRGTLALGWSAYEVKWSTMTEVFSV